MTQGKQVLPFFIRLSAPECPLVYEAIRDAGARAWQIQLTEALKPMERLKAVRHYPLQRI